MGGNRWQIEGAKTKFYDGLTPTARGIKRPFTEKHEIMTTELHEYPKLECRFNEYKLAWMSMP